MEREEFLTEHGCFFSQGSTVSEIFFQVGNGLKEVQVGDGGDLEGIDDRRRKARLAKTLFDMTMKVCFEKMLPRHCCRGWLVNENVL